VSSVFLAADSSPGAREDNKVVKGEQAAAAMGAAHQRVCWCTRRLGCRKLGARPYRLLRSARRAAYHKATLQSRHLLNITREVANLRQLKELG
jgi:hypothetical protein